MQNNQDNQNGMDVVSSSFGPSSSNGMRKKLLMYIGAGVVILIIIIVVVVLLGSHKDDSQAAKGHQAADISTSVASVAITQNGLTPASIKIKENQQLTITSQDASPHKLTADPDILPGFDTTEALNQGDSYTYTFDKKGTFHYYDPANPKAFTGTIIVE